MAWKIQKGSELPDGGRVIMIYGQTAEGKTVSTLQSLTGHTIYVRAEERDTKTSIKDSGRNADDVTVISYEGFEDVMDGLVNVDRLKEMKPDNLVFDSITEAMERLLMESADQQAQKSMKGKKADEIEKALATQVKNSVEDYGTMANWTKRILRTFSRIASELNIPVIVIARLDEGASWTKKSYAPLFTGRDFAKHAAGLLDGIGFVYARMDCDRDDKGEPIKDDAGKLQNYRAVYPPNVSFRHVDAITKSSGLMIEDVEKTKLDFGHILGEGKDAV